MAVFFFWNKESFFSFLISLKRILIWVNWFLKRELPNSYFGKATKRMKKQMWQLNQKKRVSEFIKSRDSKTYRLFFVVSPGIEPGTQGFSVLCSTNWAMTPTFLRVQIYNDFFFWPNFFQVFCYFLILIFEK